MVLHDFGMFLENVGDWSESLRENVGDWSESLREIADSFDADIYCLECLEYAPHRYVRGERKEHPACEERNGKYVIACWRVGTLQQLAYKEHTIKRQSYDETYVMKITPQEFSDGVERRNNGHSWVSATQLYLAHLFPMHGGDDECNC